MNACRGGPPWPPQFLNAGAATEGRPYKNYKGGANQRAALVT